MWIKVCGLKYADNIARVAALAPTMMGFIFYERSARCAAGLDGRAIAALPVGIRRVGVFVDTPAETIRDTAQRYGLDTAQLHGEETPEFCKRLKDEGLTVIKALGVSDPSDIRRAKIYRHACDLLLFDTKSPSRGGTGRRFDWGLLETYQETIPFLLSGGIGPEDAERLSRLSHPQLAGVDLNSRFETEAGMKDVEALRIFIRNLRAGGSH